MQRWKEKIALDCPFNSYEDSKSCGTAVQKYPDEEKYVDTHMADGM
jgi:hypothetical protein